MPVPGPMTASIKNTLAIALLLGISVGRTALFTDLCFEADREGYCVVETGDPDAGEEGVVEAEE